MIDRVLFITEKYCDADPKHGPTNSESQLIGAIESTGLVGEIKHFYYDVLCQQRGKQRMNELLIEDCGVFQPDLVVYSPMGGLVGYQLNPSDETLNQIRKRGIKLYTCLWDTVGREWETCSRWLPTTDGVLVMDAIIKAEHYKGDPRIIQAYSAIDPRDFCGKNLERNIDVSFIGAIDLAGIRWPWRIQYINFLIDNGIGVFVAGGQRQKRLSWEDYSNFLNRSKLTLNWSKNPIIGTCQLKGRVFESMSCGAMLLEDDGDQTRQLFEPGRDFIIFSSPEDLLRKIHYYLEHEEKREAIAQAGWEMATKIYNSRNMWGYLFERMGFTLPAYLAEDENYIGHKKKVLSW